MAPLLNLILDIDETLIHCTDKETWNDLSDSDKLKYKFFETSEVVFVIRPHLKELLDFAFENCRVSLWTFSDDAYARLVAKNIVLPGRTNAKLVNIFSEEVGSDEAADMHGNNKDLNYLWYDLCVPHHSECNTILVDDNHKNGLNPSNRRNTITIPPFKFDRNSYKDDALLHVMTIMKRVMASIGECYKGDERWDSVFNTANIAAYGLEDYVQYLTFKETRVPAIVASKKTMTGGRRKVKSAAAKKP